MPSDVENIDSPLAMRIRLFNRATPLRRLANNHLKIPQKCYKAGKDEKARFEPTYAPGCYVFDDRPLFTASAAERLAAEGYQN